MERNEPASPSRHSSPPSPAAEDIRAAASALRRAKALVIATGAGMGADSGLPTFRDAEGFWRDYPVFRPLGRDFLSIATERFLKEEPRLAWGIHGHLWSRFREADPHEGYSILLRWVRDLGLDAFAVTSNVDDHFRRSGFPEERILEVHGSFAWLQCASPCSDRVWENESPVEPDPVTLRVAELPACPWCGAMARPNALLFSDGGYSSRRTDAQVERFLAFRRRLSRERLPHVVLEIGAGTAVPTIRFITEGFAGSRRASLFRVNPDGDPFPGGVQLRGTALATLRAVDAALPPEDSCST